MYACGVGQGKSLAFEKKLRAKNGEAPHQISSALTL